jgi:hypothetical protein
MSPPLHPPLLPGASAYIAYFLAASFLLLWRRCAYRQVSSALPFVSVPVASSGLLGALALLGDLADRAVKSGGPDLSWAASVSGALRELGVALCRGNGSQCRSGAYVATRAAGRTPMRGLAQRSTEEV